ncbi:hypothetical protein RCOM_0422020 [Ricinus communis]|uniref:MADS-box domain-containing protein n=1 Tax=Ricinus communis TaxID=3988 RepID=B9SDL7_RICCO|nr:hypothetical protein RCOM_0422020 [Ricinus communis]
MDRAIEGQYRRKKIEDKHQIETTFAKRTEGLFKKVDELCYLYGANAAAVTFSPHGIRPYAFGLPTSCSVIHHFLDGDDQRWFKKMVKTGFVGGGRCQQKVLDVAVIRVTFSPFLTTLTKFMFMSSPVKS